MKKQLFTLLFSVYCLALLAQQPIDVNNWNWDTKADLAGYEWVLIPEQEAKVLVMAGASGYEVAEARPAGPEIRAGFLYRAGSLALSGGGGYNSYSVEGKTLRFWNFEGGIGGFVIPRLAVTANLAYYGQRDGKDGAFGVVIRPWFTVATIGEKLDVTVAGGLGFTDDFFAWSGLLGLGYRLSK